MKLIIAGSNEQLQVNYMRLELAAAIGLALACKQENISEEDYTSNLMSLYSADDDTIKQFHAGDKDVFPVPSGEYRVSNDFRQRIGIAARVGGLQKDVLSEGEATLYLRIIQRLSKKAITEVYNQKTDMKVLGMILYHCRTESIVLDQK